MIARLLCAFGLHQWYPLFADSWGVPKIIGRCCRRCEHQHIWGK